MRKNRKLYVKVSLSANLILNSQWYPLSAVLYVLKGTSTHVQLDDMDGAVDVEAACLAALLASWIYTTNECHADRVECL